MALQTSGAISLANIQTEFGGSNPISISEYYGAAAGVPTSGAIAIGHFYGKSSQFTFTISTNQTNANLATLATAAGWDGSSNLQATINSGVYISSNSTGTPALTVSGSYPAGVTLINNGYIVGMGGSGAKGSARIQNNSATPYSGSSGGGALSVSSAITIQNNGTIGGGGGGGGAGGLALMFNNDNDPISTATGGGGGGGRGGSTNSSGGARGEYWYPCYTGYGSAGGSGTSSGAGAGGSGGYASYQGQVCAGGNGGSGGNWGSSGGGGGAGYKISGFTLYRINPSSGGGAGYAVSGNGNITWSATGTRLGAIS